MTLFERLVSPDCGCDSRDLTASLLPVNTALEQGLAMVTPLVETEILPLLQAKGRVLAQDIVARADLPQFDNSGMDGYALRFADLAGRNSLPVCDTSAAGDTPQTLPEGCAMRIYTGAPVPKGADTVIMQERVTRIGDTIRCDALPKQGANIRLQGEDQRARTVVLSAGIRLNTRHLALCAGAGHGQVEVTRRPRVALLITGDELTPAGEMASGGAIWDVNTPMLISVLEDLAEIVLVQQVPDSFDAMRHALHSAAQQADLIVTSGGVSVGDRDHVKPALRELGAQIRVSGVAIKPGKPITLSQLDHSTVVSLPGNPLSAYVTWQVFGAPLLNRLAGLAEAIAPRRHVRCHSALRHKLGRCEYRPARLAGFDESGLEVVTCPKATHSGHLGPMAAADGLVLIPGDIETTTPGDLLEFLPF